MRFLFFLHSLNPSCAKASRGLERLEKLMRGVDPDDEEGGGSGGGSGDADGAGDAGASRVNALEIQVENSDGAFFCSESFHSAWDFYCWIQAAPVALSSHLLRAAFLVP